MSSALLPEVADGGNAAAAAAAPLEQSLTVYMAVVEDGPRLAFAAYNEEQNRIILEQCAADGYEVQELIERVLLSVRPTLLLLPSKIVGNHDLLELLTTAPPQINDDGVAADDDNEDEAARENTTVPGVFSATTRRGQQHQLEQSRCIPYRIVKSSALDVRACMSLIMKLRVSSLLRQAVQHGQAARGLQPPRRFPLASAGSQQSFPVSNYHSLASIVDFESKLQVQAVGSLLSFLLTTAFHLEEGSIITVNDVVQAHSSMFMKVPAYTLSALNIFATEHHPLVAAKGTGNSKEGFSLFSLLDRTKSRAGRDRLREWMLKPLLDVDAIALRQDGVELFMLPDFRGPTKTLLELMGRVGSVIKILTRFQKSCSKPTDFLLLPRTLSNALAVCDTLQHEFLFRLQQSLGPDPSQLPDMQQQQQQQQQQGPRNPEAAKYIAFVDSILSRCHVIVLQELLERITSIVDEEATAESNTVVVLPGNHLQLDEYKEKYANLGATLKAIGAELGEQMPHLSEIMTVVYFPQVGFLVALKRDSSWSNEDSLTEDFEFLFAEHDTWYFKTSDMYHLDEKIGDLDGFIKDTEAMIASDLEDDILDCDPELRETFSALAELDCILAFAQIAADLGYVRPQVVPANENCIQIQNGGHPLQEHITVVDFVRNDTNVDGTNRVNIITGPNFSGKSCYARQVGILTYMAHIGSFLPCDAARISVVDQILAQFSSVETCAVPQSSFQLDLTRMGAMMRSATPKSLILIDEFGKGTSPASGIALLTASLKRFSQVNCKVLCTTHFLEIFSMKLVVDGENGVKALQMTVRIPEKTTDLAVPLFKLEEGVANSSAGLVCAKMAGVKPAVITRANEIVTAMKENRQVQPLTEILRDELGLSQMAKETAAQFIKTDWKAASDEEVCLFREKILRM